MMTQIDKLCSSIGVWPHAFLSGHAHNYQRLTRTRTADGSQVPYVVCGNMGHNAQPLGSSIRAPQIIQKAQSNKDQVVLDNYDAARGHFGYLRLVVTKSQLRIEYHPASDGVDVKTPDDAVTVDLKTRRIVHFDANDHGRLAEGRSIHNLRTAGDCCTN